MILLTSEEYSRLMEQHDKHAAWLGSRTSYKEEEVPEGCHSLHNEASSLCEVYRVFHEKPRRLFAYVNVEKRQVITWCGDVLGIATLGPVYEVPAFGRPSKRQSITLSCMNGLTYYGTYYTSSGDYCRLTAKKAA